MTTKTGIWVLALLLVAGGALGWFLSRPRPLSNALPPLSPDAKAYVRSLQLSEVTMQATESYVKQTVTEVEGKITNTGVRAVKQAELYCVFYNSYGEVILREKVPIVRTTLKPGEMRPFRLPFDDIPASWNNQMPQLVIARIEFTG
jgi:hypothetical protein